MHLSKEHVIQQSVQQTHKAHTDINFNNYKCKNLPV